MNSAVARLGPRLVHTPSEPSGSQRSPAVSSGRSFAQVAGAILRKQARGQNPDKDEVPGSSPGRPTSPLTSGMVGHCLQGPLSGAFWSKNAYLITASRHAPDA